LESLGYIFLYFACGSLPWQGLKAATEDEKDALVKEEKESLSGEKLCGGFLPSEFATYINYTRSPAFGHKPDYAYLRRLFRRLFRVKGFRYDHAFDWTEKRFQEMQRALKPKISGKRQRQEGRATPSLDRPKRDLRRVRTARGLPHYR
jgi:casein kinase 1 delta/casein kinase I family protein HRR25